MKSKVKYLNKVFDSAVANRDKKVCETITEMKSFLLSHLLHTITHLYSNVTFDDTPPN
jgi:hypothetical protein